MQYRMGAALLVAPFNPTRASLVPAKTCGRRGNLIVPLRYGITCVTRVSTANECL